MPSANPASPSRIIKVSHLLAVAEISSIATELPAVVKANMRKAPKRSGIQRNPKEPIAAPVKKVAAAKPMRLSSTPRVVLI
jgi:hypothetical protein